MSQVKETIDLLTRVLRGNGTSKIKAEIFRLAKFDKDEAVSSVDINRIYDGVEAETRKSQASFQIIWSYARLASHKT